MRSLFKSLRRRIPVPVGQKLSPCGFAFLISALLTRCVLAQVQTPVASANILCDHATRHVVLPYNSPEDVSKEMLSAEVLWTLGASRGLTSNDIATLRVSTLANSNGVRVTCTGASEHPLAVVHEELSSYVRERMNGHTKDFLLMAARNRLEPSQVSDPDLRLLLQQYSVPGAKWLRKIHSNSWTNKAGTEQGWAIVGKEKNGRAYLESVTNILKTDEVYRSVVFLQIDSEVAWLYNITLGPKDRVIRFAVNRRDAQEYDPNYSGQFEEVNREIKNEMPWTSQWPGAAPTTEQTRKRKLRARGIEWRTSSELNPDAREGHDVSY